jgi:hypothetical protein
LFIGDDWAEDHHDVEIVNATGARLARRRLPEGVAGLAGLHALIADHLGPDQDAAQVVIGIETDRGPWVQALLAAGYLVYAINPLQSARYRERHSVSGAKSDPGDAHVLAELVRLDRAHHRPIAGDTVIAEHVKIVARAHQSMVWSRQRQTNSLRSMLGEYYPGALAVFGADLAGRDALTVLALAPTPEQGARLSEHQVGAALRRAGRQRNITTRAADIVAGLRTEQLAARPGVVSAYAAAAQALLAVITELARQTHVLEGECRRVLAGTRTLRSTAANPGSDRSSAPGCLPSSAMTPTATPTPGPVRTTPGWPRSPEPRGSPGRCWPATPATAAWPTPSTNKPSPP